MSQDFWKQFKPRKPEEISNEEAIATANKVGYELDPKNLDYEERLATMKTTISNVDKMQVDPELNALMGALRQSQN